MTAAPKEITEALISIARGRKPCPSGSQRVSRDELVSIARAACLKAGINWQEKPLP